MAVLMLVFLFKAPYGDHCSKLAYLKLLSRQLLIAKTYILDTSEETEEALQFFF